MMMLTVSGLAKFVSADSAALSCLGLGPVVDGEIVPFPFSNPYLTFRASRVSELLPRFSWKVITLFSWDVGSSGAKTGKRNRKASYAGFVVPLFKWLEIFLFSRGEGIGGNVSGLAIFSVFKLIRIFFGKTMVEM